MKDLLKLTDSSIKLQERYDNFLLWCNDNSVTIADIVAIRIGVTVSIVDIFFELGDLDDEEFDTIDNNGFDVHSLFLIVRCKKSLRLKIYKNASSLLSHPQPLTAIRLFIENESMPDFNSLIQQLSADGLKSVSRYITERKIIQGTITTGFPGMLKRAAKYQSEGIGISEKMSDWIMRGVAKDKYAELNIFDNDILKNNFRDDYDIFQQLILIAESIDE